MSCDLIYNLNLEGVMGDRRAITLLLPLFIDWQMHHPAEPFDVKKAEKEFPRHAAEAIKRKTKRQAYAKKKFEKEQKKLRDLCRTIAEEHFQLVLTGEDFGEKIINWGDTITDPPTGEKIGTPRDLWKVAWVRDIDPRKDKDGYINKIRNRFDGKSHRFSFTRPPTKFERLRRIGLVVSPVEKAPFDVERNPTCYYELTLRWK